MSIGLDLDRVLALRRRYLASPWPAVAALPGQVFDGRMGVAIIEPSGLQTAAASRGWA
jgi:hypothetical protein